MTMRSSTKRNLFIGVTAAFILAVIIFQFNGQRLRALKRHVSTDRKYQRQHNFVNIPRNIGKNGLRERGLSYRVDNSKRLGQNQVGVSQDRLSDKVGAGRRDWWKVGTSKKTPSNQAPLGRWVNTSRTLQSRTDGRLSNVPRTETGDRRGVQLPASAIGKSLPYIVNTAQIAKQMLDEKRQGNNFGVNNPAGNRMMNNLAVKRNNSGRFYDGRQITKSSFEGRVGVGREGVRPAGQRREMWTKQDKIAALQRTRSTDKTPDGSRTQYISNDRKQRPIGERGGATDVEKNPKTTVRNGGPAGFQSRSGSERKIGQKSDPTAPNRKPQIRGKDGSLDGFQKQGELGGERRLPIGERRGSANTNRGPQTRGKDRVPQQGELGGERRLPIGERRGSADTNRGPQTRGKDRVQQQGELGGERRLSIGRRGDSTVKAQQNRGKDFISDESRKQRQFIGGTQRRDGQRRDSADRNIIPQVRDNRGQPGQPRFTGPLGERRQRVASTGTRQMQPGNADQAKKGQQTFQREGPAAVRNTAGMSKRPSGNNADVLKSGGNKQGPGYIRGENGNQKRMDTNAVGDRKRRPDGSFAKETPENKRTQAKFNTTGDKKTMT